MPSVCRFLSVFLGQEEYFPEMFHLLGCTCGHDMAKKGVSRGLHRFKTENCVGYQLPVSRATHREPKKENLAIMKGKEGKTPKQRTL